MLKEPTTTVRLVRIRNLLYLYQCALFMHYAVVDVQSALHTVCVLSPACTCSVCSCVSLNMQYTHVCVCDLCTRAQLIAFNGKMFQPEGLCQLHADTRCAQCE